METLLLENVAIVNGPEKIVPAGRYAFSVWGTSIGQATVRLERKMPNGAWFLAQSTASLTAFGIVNVELPAGIYRATVTDGGTDPSGVYASLAPLIV